jgi:hypothetical protein
MCCTLEPAKLSKTILYAGDTTIDGQYRHVLGYQNKAENLFTGPNAMILPFPSAERMGPDNVIDVGENKTVLADMAEALERRDRRFAKGMRSLSMGEDALLGSYVEVFDSGDYTVVLAADARDIPQVLNRVPENKRPRINREIFAAYAQWYPNWPIALCCFEAKKAVENQPMLWWYLPTSHDTLFLPGLDGHSGHVPNLKEKVDREHSIVVGTTAKTAQLTSQGSKVIYGSTLSTDLKKFVPEYVVGGKMHLPTPNGDFQVRTAKVHEARYGFDTVAPPGA